MASGGPPDAPAANVKMTPDQIQINSELEWIKFREETLGPAAYGESGMAKFVRKIKENPFVPIGAMGTVCALGYGLWCFRQGRGRDSQLMMRMRIGAQGFTILAILGGVLLGASKVPTHSGPHPVK